MNSENSSFRFKIFELTQQRATMKVGTDGVLLGAWAKVQKANTFLDVGAGTGVVALMLAQRNPQATGSCLEPDIEAFHDLTQNIEKSPFNERLTAVNAAFQEYEGPTVDLIISNPPFFQSGNIARGARGVARHTTTLPYSDLLKYSVKHLKKNGRLSVILPFEEGGQFIDMAPSLGLFLSRQCLVFPNETKPPIRRLLEFGKRLLKVEHTSMKIRQGVDLSQEFTQITSDFYLDGNSPHIA